MKNKLPDRSRLLSRISLIISWTVAPLIAGSLAGLCFVLAAGAARQTAPLAALVALTVASGTALQLSRARGRRRLRTALDAYAEREIARAAALSRPRNSQRRPAMRATVR